MGNANRLPSRRLGVGPRVERLDQRWGDDAVLPPGFPGVGAGTGAGRVEQSSHGGPVDVAAETDRPYFLDGGALNRPTVEVPTDGRDTEERQSGAIS